MPEISNNPSLIPTGNLSDANLLAGGDLTVKIDDDPPATISSDQYLLIDAGVVILIIAAGKAVAKAFGSEIWSKFVSSTTNKILQKVTSRFPPTPTPAQKEMFNILYSAKSFSKGIDEIKTLWPELSPLEILETAFEFPYRFNPKTPLARANVCMPNVITPEDIVSLMTTYKLTAPQILERAELAHQLLGASRSDIWSNIFSSIFTANRGVTTSTPLQVGHLDKALTESQQLFLGQLQREQIRLELDTIKDVLKEIRIAIEKAAAGESGRVDAVKIGGQFQVEIGPDVLGQTISRFALVQWLEGIITSIEDETSLAPEEERFLQRLKGKNPILQKIIDARIHNTKTEIDGTNQALEMMRSVQRGENTWFAKVLMEVAGFKGPVKAGIVVMDDAGKATARYEFNYNTSTPRNSGGMSLYAEGDPHPTPPLRFGKGYIFVVRGNSVSMNEGLAITDARVRTSFRTTDEIEQLRETAREVVANQRLRRSNYGRAFLRYFNKIQAILLSIDGEFKIEPGSPESKIRKLAENLKRQNWTAELEHRIDSVAREYSGSYPGEEIQKLRRDFIDRFNPKIRHLFKKLTLEFAKAVESGDHQARGRSVTGIKELLARQIGVRYADRLSLDLFAETNAWLEAGSLTRYLGDTKLPENLRPFVIARGVDKGIPPTFERARSYARDGSIDRAFLEYDRIVAEPETSGTERVIALAEKAKLAVDTMQFPRARRAVGRIKWLEATGVETPKEAKAIIDGLPPLNGGERVVVASSTPSTPQKPKVAEAAPSVSEVEIDTSPDQFKPSMTKGLVEFAKGARDLTYEVGGPATMGMLTFLFSQELIENIFDKPATQIEGIFQSYEVMGTAILIDHGLQKGAEYFVWKGAERTFVPVLPFGLKTFFGNLGASSIVYRMIEAPVKRLGASERTAQIVGLAGTGAALGGWKPLLKKLLPPEKVLPVITSAENIITKGGLVYAVVDGVPSLAEGVYNYFDSPISVAARDEWYYQSKKYYLDRDLFGSSDDVTWYNRIFYTAYNVLDVAVPATWHKAWIPFDDNAQKWINWCENQLRNNYSCRN